MGSSIDWHLLGTLSYEISGNPENRRGACYRFSGDIVLRILEYVGFQISYGVVRLGSLEVMRRTEIGDWRLELALGFAESGNYRFGEKCKSIIRRIFEYTRFIN